MKVNKVGGSLNIEVRKYRESDLEDVNELLMEAFNIRKNNFLSSNYQEIVLCVDGKVAGYTLLTKIENPIKNIFYIDRR